MMVNARNEHKEMRCKLRGRTLNFGSLSSRTTAVAMSRQCITIHFTHELRKLIANTQKDQVLTDDGMVQQQWAQHWGTCHPFNVVHLIKMKNRTRYCSKTYSNSLMWGTFTSASEHLYDPSPQTLSHLSICSFNNARTKCHQAHFREPHTYVWLFDTMATVTLL